MKVILSDDGLFGMQFNHIVIRNAIMKVSSAYCDCDFLFVDDLYILMDLSSCHDLGALKTL